jgi:tetratricopeptide (TPR) repeat protein
MNSVFNKQNTEITNIEEAKREYRKAEYLDNIGYIHKSIEYFKKAIKLDPENEAYQSKLENVIKERSDEEYQKAILLESQRKYLDAINHCEEAMIINPDNKEYKNKLNILKEKHNGQKEAEPYYEKAIELEKEGKLKKAIKYCDKAIKVDPYEINYYKTKGNCLFNIKSLFKKNYKKSMECYDKLIELEPDNSYFYSRKAECLEKLGRNEEAKEYYDVAKKNDKK